MIDFEHLLRTSGIPGIPVMVSKFVPLYEVYEPTGAKVDVACWFVFGMVLVHPSRWDSFQAEMRSPGPSYSELGRWADDGGR